MNDNLNSNKGVVKDESPLTTALEDHLVKYPEIVEMTPTQDGNTLVEYYLLDDEGGCL